MTCQGMAFETLLDRLVESGLVTARGRQRTDATHVLAAVRDLNRLEMVGETLRAALEALAAAAPQWLAGHLDAAMVKRYGARIDEPAEHLMDAGYPSTKTLLTLRTEHQVRLIAPMRGDSSRHAREGSPYARDNAWKHTYRARAGIEGTIHQATAVTGIRQARYTGLGKVGLEHAFAAAAINLIRLYAWWTGTPLQRTRTTHLSRLDLTLAA
jgi:hypothetical protein